MNVRVTGRGDATAALGTITPGFRRFLINKGQWSLLDLARAVLNQSGPADIDITCWVAAEEDIGGVLALVKSGAIQNVRWLVGRGLIGAEQKRYADRLLAFGVEHIRTTRIHAKMITVRNESWQIAIRGSANLNTNRQFEQFDVSDDSEIVAAITGVIDELWTLSPPGLDVEPGDREQAFRAAINGENDAASERREADRRRLPTMSRPPMRMGGMARG